MNRKQRRAAAKASRSRSRSSALNGTAISDKGETYNVRTQDGRPFIEAYAIFPIFKEIASGQPVLIGTGFYVTRFGHFLTARHVLMDLHECGKPGFMLHMLDDHKSAIVRYVKSFSAHAMADIALGALEHPPGYVFNSVPSLTAECPAIGDKILTVAYDNKTRLENREWTFSPEYLSGQFEEAHPEGRDSVLLPFPCYRSSITIPGGASGGPVFDQHGRVFAINCTGYDGTDISYLARIEEVLPLTATGMMFGPNDPPTDQTLLELARGGYVIFTPPI